jgi:hypothetical protein
MTEHWSFVHMRARSAAIVKHTASTQMMTYGATWPRPEPMNAKPRNIEIQVGKLPKTQSEIERLLLTELQASPDCEEAQNIIVVASDHCTATWTVSSFHPGKSNGMACDLALQHIVPRLQSVYDLVRKH